MEVHDVFECDMDCLIKECACLFHDRWLGVHFYFFLHSVFQAMC